MATQSNSKAEDLINRLKVRFPDAVKASKVDGPRRILITFDRSKLLEIATFMRDDMGFDHVKGIAGIDEPTHKLIKVLYFAGSFSKTEIEDIIIVLETELDRGNPVIASTVSVWPSSHFHERETFEMFGVKFEGHPDLRRLLTLDNWEGPPPMLKDIKFPEMGQR